MAATVLVRETTRLPDHKVVIKLDAMTAIGRIVIPLTLADSGSQAGNEAEACRTALAAFEAISAELRRQLRWER
jgi:hypothetical protein